MLRLKLKHDCSQNQWSDNGNKKLGSDETHQQLQTLLQEKS